MSQKLTIEFKAKGSGALKKTLNDLHQANLKLIGAQGKYANSNKFVQREQEKTRKGMLDLQRSTRQTDNSFSVLRSKLLLASFAMGLAIRPILNLAKAAGDMDEIMSKANVVFGDNSEVVGRWASALGSEVGRAKSTLMEMVSTLQDTFVPLGFTRDSATQLSTSLTKLAIDVASFNNKMDADVVRDFQSAIVGNHETVRKYGIVITEASLKQEAYIMGISNGVSELSAAEKVQARLSLIQKGSADAMGDAKRTADSYANTIKRFSEFWKENAEAVGNALKPYIKFVATMLSSKTVVNGLAKSLSALAVGFFVVKGAAFLAQVSLQNFKKAAIRSGIFAITIALGYLAEKFYFSKEAADNATKANEDAEDAIANLTSEIELAIEATEKQTTSVEDSVHALITQYVQLGRNSTAQVYSREVGRSLTEQEEKLIAMIDEKNASMANEERITKMINGLYANTIQGKKDLIQLQIREIQLQMEHNKQLAGSIMFGRDAAEFQETINGIMETGLIIMPKHQEELDKLILQYQKAGLAIDALVLSLQQITPQWVETTMQLRDALATLASMTAEIAEEAREEAQAHLDIINEIADAEIQALQDKTKAQLNEEKKTRRWMRMTREEQVKYEKKIQEKLAADEAIINAKRQADKEAVAKKANDLMKKQFRVDQALSITEAIINTHQAITNALTLKPTWVGIAMASVVGAMGAAQVAMIASQKPPTMQMAEGGIIGGRLHSQGGTMVEAERGEFVMRRSAVDSIGLETLNRLNAGGSTGNIIINFSGNVLSDDYIEDEAIPKIKEALRRGGDIGVG